MIGNQIEKPALIVSAESADSYNTENVDRTVRLRFYLREMGAAFKEVQGCYEGKKETAFFVIPKDAEQAKDIVFIAFHDFGQSSVLHLDHWRKATLETYKGDGRDNPKTPIGQWRSVPEIVALSRDSWTFDPSTKTYYVCD